MTHRSCFTRIFGFAVAGILVAVFLAACDKSSSPTAPVIPRDPVAQPAMYFAWINLLVVSHKVGGGHPRAGEVLIDGQSVWAGSIGEPYLDDLEVEPFNVWASRPGNLAAGTHTLTFRVTDQARSPTGYLLSGYVVLGWDNSSTSYSSIAAAWRNVPVRLRTGEAWTSEFVVPVTPP